MNTANKLNKKSLVTQLENYKVVFHANQHLLEEDRLLKEHVSHRMVMLESTLVELEVWERANNQREYDQSLDRANRILHGIKLLAEYMLSPTNPPDESFQSIASRPYQ